MNDAKPVLINSVSGLRGIVGSSLTVENAMQFACVTGRLLADLSTESKGSIHKTIVIARDSRPSGPLLNHAVSAGLMAMGLDVIEAGIASTPTVGVLVRLMGGFSPPIWPISYQTILVTLPLGKIAYSLSGHL